MLQAFLDTAGNIYAAATPKSPNDCTLLSVSVHAMKLLAAAEGKAVNREYLELMVQRLKDEEANGTGQEQD